MGMDPAPSSLGRSWRPEASAALWTRKVTSCQLTSVPWSVSHLDHKGSPLQQEQLQKHQVLPRKGGLGAPTGIGAGPGPRVHWAAARQCPLFA